MPSLATVSVIGHMTEPKQVGQNGLSFSVAVSDKTKDGAETTTWFRCAVFDKEWFASKAQKGALVHVTGKPVMREYTTKDGEVRQSLEIKFCNATVLSGGADVSGGEGSEGGGGLPF